jgi:hypothetical protein
MQHSKQRKLLAQAADLIGQADALVQEALGPTDECYEMHCALANVVDELDDKLDELAAEDFS